MKKGKLATIIISSVLFVGAASGTALYLIIKDGNTSEYEELRSGMKPWSAPTLDGLSVYVPDDYEEKEKEYFDVSYVKDGAQISLTWEDVDNDLDNYVYYALDSYRKATDAFSLRQPDPSQPDPKPVGEFGKMVEFDYTLSLESGEKKISCLSAFVMGEGKAYILTCTADTDEYASFSDDFYRTYKTMQLVGKNDKKDNNE